LWRKLKPCFPRDTYRRNRQPGQIQSIFGGFCRRAKRLIAAKDSYTANWSPFDIAARLENPEGKREDLVSLAVREVREWTAEVSAADRADKEEPE